MSHGTIVFGCVSIPVVITYSKFATHLDLQIQEFIPTNTADTLMVLANRLLGPTRNLKAFTLLSNMMAKLGVCAVVAIPASGARRAEVAILRPFNGSLLLQSVDEPRPAVLACQQDQFDEDLAEAYIQANTVERFDRSKYTPSDEVQPSIVNLTEALKIMVAS